MYAMINPGKTYDDENKCLSQGMLYRRANTSEKDLAFVLYPNPASQKVKFQYQIPTDEVVSAEIRNNLGQILYAIKLDHSKNEEELNLSKYEDGVYNILLVTEKRIVSQGKLVIIHEKR